MRKVLITTVALLATISGAMADIQSPPGAQYTSTRKLGRALSNILYGVVEIPEQIVRKTNSHGSKAGWSYGLVDGTKKAYKRIGYGFYELFTFRCPTYHGTFKPPYERCGADNNIHIDPSDGMHEFPPELGAESYYYHTRTQSY